MNEPNVQDQSKLLQSLAQKSQPELVEILGQLLLDYARNLDTGGENGAVGPDLLDQGEFKSFPEFMEDCLRKYRFPELRRFRVEGKKVFLMFHDREIEITGKMETLGRTGTLPAPPAASSHGIKQKPASEDNKPSLSAPKDNVRFKNLEL